MYNMKKIITALLSLCICSSYIPFSGIVNAEETTVVDLKGTDEYKLLYSLGVIPESIEDKMTADTHVTRGDFAAVIYQIINNELESGAAIPEEWDETFWGDDAIYTPIVPVVKSGYYNDIDSSYEYFDQINFVTNYGLMNGVGNGGFAPDREMKYGEMIKVMVKMLGYGKLAEIDGGYPAGYINRAETLGIRSIADNHLMTYHDFVNILYDMLEIEVMEIGVSNGEFQYFVSEDSTFMSKWLKAAYKTGIFTDNSITSVSGESAISKGMLTVGDITYQNKCKYDINDYLGYNVKVYYSLDEEYEGYALAVVPDRKNIVTEFDILDFVSYNNRTIEYMEGKKTERVKLSETLFVIYNGKSIASWNPDIFEFSNGNVKIIENGDWYDVIVIEDYQTWIVSGVDIKNHKIYNKTPDKSDVTEDEILEYEEALENEQVYVYSADGSVLDIENVVTGMTMDFIENGNYLKIILSDNRVSEFIVKQIGTDNDGNKIISNGETTYIVSPDYYTKKNSAQFMMGQNYTLYLNKQGFVIWQDLKLVSNMTVGYLVRTVLVDEEETVKVKIFDETGKMHLVFSGEKVVFRSNPTEKYKLEYDKLYAKIRDYNGLVRFKLDDEGKLKELEVVSDTPQNQEYLQTIYDSGDSTLIYKTYSNWGFFGGEVYSDNNTKVFCVPKDDNLKNDDDYYTVSLRGDVFKYDVSYPVKAYSTKEGTRYADYILYEVDRTATLTRCAFQFFIVEKVSVGIDANEEQVLVLDGFKCGDGTTLTETTVYARYDKTDKYGNTVTAVDIMDDVLNTQLSKPKEEKNLYKVQKGDIIRCSYSGANREYVEQAELFFRLNGQNPAFPNGKEGYLAGSIGYFDNNPTVIDGKNYTYNPYSNPYGFTSASVFYDCRPMTSGSFRAFYGFVQDLNDGIVTSTTKDLSVGKFETDNPKYDVDYQFIAKTVIAWTIDGNNYDAKTGTVSDIRTAEEYGKDCSRIIYISQGGIPYTIFIINEI